MNERHGTVMIIMLLMFVVGGIVASQVLPSYILEKNRTDEKHLRATMSRIRQAFDLRVAIDPNFPPSNYTAQDVMNVLVTSSFFPRSLATDSTMSWYSWNVGANSWVLVNNVASNTSFEDIITGGPDPTWTLATWSKGTQDSVATTDTFYPGKNTMMYDDYYGQNKFGKILTNTGFSLKLTK